MATVWPQPDLFPVLLKNHRCFMLKPVLLIAGLLLAIPAYPQDASNSPSVVVDEAKTLPEDDISVVIKQFKADSTQTREYALGKISEAYNEDHGNPALKLERMLSHDKGTLLDIIGLNRTGKKFSAIIDTDTLYLQNIKSGKQYKLILQVGGTKVDGKGDKKLLQVMPGEHIYLFFEAIDDLQAHSLRYNNWSGRPDSYFDVIDPRFRERYDASYSKAGSGNVEDMKSFLLEFARNDPDNRAQKIFVALINKLHSLNTFDGYYQSYQLLKDPADEKAASRLAKTEEQQSKLQAAVNAVKQAEAAKQEEARRAQEAKAAELRKREEARQAELKKQDEVRQAEQQAAQAKADEEKCMRTPACRKAWEIQQAKCEQEIMSCRGQCDRVAGVGRYGGFAAITAAVMARACYSACKCGSSFGSLLGKFNSMVADNHTSSTATTSKQASENKQQTTNNSKSTPATPSTNNSQKTFECKVYCKSADGPVTYHTVKAASRREAAKMVGDNANEICASDNKQYASRIEFSESQCREK